VSGIKAGNGMRTGQGGNPKSFIHEQDKSERNERQHRRGLQ